VRAGCRRFLWGGYIVCGWTCGNEPADRPTVPGHTSNPPPVRSVNSKPAPRDPPFSGGTPPFRPPWEALKRFLFSRDGPFKRPSLTRLSGEGYRFLCVSKKGPWPEAWTVRQQRRKGPTNHCPWENFLAIHLFVAVPGQRHCRLQEGFIWNNAFWLRQDIQASDDGLPWSPAAAGKLAFFGPFGPEVGIPRMSGKALQNPTPWVRIPFSHVPGTQPGPLRKRDGQEWG